METKIGEPVGAGDGCGTAIVNVTALRSRIAELEKLVYVPGLWRCAKCEFQLVQANLHVRSGAVTARDTPGEKCPNCSAPLWRVTEREAGNEMVRRCEQLVAENAELRRAIEEKR